MLLACRSIGALAWPKFSGSSFPVKRTVQLQFSVRPNRTLQYAGSVRRMSTSVKASASQVETGPQISEEEQQEVDFWTRIQKHQKEAPKMSSLDEARTVLNRSKRGMLSTFSKKYEGYPFGSTVGYAVDDFGRPILAISSLSPHTSDLEKNSQCSLLVSNDFNIQSEALVALVGNAIRVPDSETAAVREIYLKKHPDAFWVDFGDFHFVRIETKAVRFTNNIATFAIGAAVAEFSGEEFKSGTVDPISSFESPISSHMNRDHEDATIAMVENAIGVKVSSAKILTVDRFGFVVEVPLKGQMSRIRLPFPRPAEDRKDVKNLIVQMTQEAKGGKKEEEKASESS